jgi:3-deoxy-D-arabino-heptulosonate 7-phosphate (DAHP) synthase
MNTPIIIAGPCAAESIEQIDIAIAEACRRPVDFLRVNLWKPRTKPGFDGLGEQGFPLLERVAKAGLNPGLEVIMPAQVTQVMDVVLPHLHQDGKLLLWIGARNQNHIVQRDIAKLIAQDSRVMMMVKNQPWKNEDHWEGIIEHVLGAGLPKENLLNCHRGFAPHDENSLGLRNVPDFAMCQRIKEKTGVPIIFDPSHTGGTVPNVFKMAEVAASQHIDGVIVEVHHDPAHALTDQKQQITWPEFDKLLAILHMDESAKRIV